MTLNRSVSTSAVAAGLLGLGILYVAPVPGLPKAWATNLIGFVILILTLLGALERAGSEPWVRKAWRLFALAIVLISLHTLLVFRFLIFHGIAMPNPPLGGLVALTTALGLVGLSAFTFGRSFERTKPGREGALDALIFAGALYLLFWMWVVKPLHVAHAVPGLLWLLQGIFLVLAATLGAAAHALSTRDLSLRSPLGLLTLALALLTVVVPFWVKAILSDGFSLIHPIRLLPLTSYALLWAATQVPWPARRSHSGRLVFLVLLPYVPAVLAFAGAMATYLPRGADRDPLGIGLLAGLAWLLLARQGLAIRQIWDLNRNLEQKVEARTQELVASQALVARTRQLNLIATLGAGLAHDINNLLSGALSMVDVIRDNPGYLTPETRQDLDGVAQAVSRAGALTHRIMAIGREEPAGGAAVDLLLHLRELEPVLRALIPRRINLSVAVGAGPMALPMSRAALDQVLVNLVLNARDATPPGGTIRIAARAEAPWVFLEVEDSGSGIPADVLARIFDPFFTTKVPGKGTGLGLASVRTVVEGLGGQIEVDTQVGRGSRFVVRLRTEGAPA